MESVLRPFDLGPTQWYVIYALANIGPTAQRDLVLMLHVERATLSGVLLALAKKGFVNQEPDPGDQRQKILTLTDSGRALWERLPDPIDLIQRTAFDGVSSDDLATTARVLSHGTARLNDLISKGKLR